MLFVFVWYLPKGEVWEKKIVTMRVQFHAYDNLCQCQMMTGDTGGSKKSCTEAIRIDDQPRLYCERAEAYLAEDMFDEAISDYRAALERDEGFSRAKEGMAKAQKLQKQVETCE